MNINLKEIWEKYPDDYDKICKLLCKSIGGDKKEEEKAKLALDKYELSA